MLSRISGTTMNSLLKVSRFFYNLQTKIRERNVKR